MTDHTELRKLAMAYPMEYDPMGKTGEENLQRCLNYNALHAACTPDAILSLLDRLEKAEKDAERYRWLRERYTAVNFDWEESGQQAVIFTADDFPVATASCDETIDRAMEASK